MNITQDRFDCTVDVRSPEQMVGNDDPQKLKRLNLLKTRTIENDVEG